MLLPIIKYKTQILQALETHQNIILVGDTGKHYLFRVFLRNWQNHTDTSVFVGG